MAGVAVSALGITSLAVAEGGEVISEKTNRIKNPSKNDSDVWNKLERVKGSDMKKSGKGRNTKYYAWDHTHNDIEVYNRYGEHLGSMNPTTGEMYKGPVAGRTINVP